jgi:hypothetical protein
LGVTHCEIRVMSGTQSCGSCGKFVTKLWKVGDGFQQKHPIRTPVTP